MRQDDSSRFALRACARVLPSLLLGAMLTTGCATPVGPSGPGANPAADRTQGDPLESANRKLFDFGRGLDRRLVRPIVGGYRRITTRPLRTAIHNVLQNLDEPLVFLNDVLQLHPGAAIRTAARFAGNSTIGVAGLFDPATRAGLPHHDNGFGSTLGRYGVGSGPYVYIPLLGPTSLRDMVGEGVDYMTDPVSQVLPKARKVAIARTGFTLLDERETAEADLRKLETAADPYATMRSVYLQSRDADIKGPDAPLEALPEIPAEPPAPPPSGDGPADPASPPAPPPDRVAQPAPAP